MFINLQATKKHALELLLTRRLHGELPELRRKTNFCSVYKNFQVYILKLYDRYTHTYIINEWSLFIEPKLR